MQWTDLSVLLSGLGEARGGRANYCCGELRYSNYGSAAAALFFVVDDNLIVIVLYGHCSKSLRTFLELFTWNVCLNEEEMHSR